ncbi:hypothetical protein B0T18DRAFT_427105 [Schizothecium vesticola]|uniref:MFS general substrate transporter n=1 Tax=Schizothecium vesticola TaxID=314040 RepID=A0AA40F090_9PEZI|nr:hypothetical protein B0T18DRAFT_427105 [Schizothecium vesticola]
MGPASPRLPPSPPRDNPPPLGDRSPADTISIHHYKHAGSGPRSAYTGEEGTKERAALDPRFSDESSIEGEDVLRLQNLDPVMNRKMHLVNNALDKIGWTSYHTKLFFLNGFGDKGLSISAYTSMFVEAFFWGFSADVVGQPHAFNLLLLICGVEYLPGNNQWVLTMLAAWWGLGQAITGFIAWGFLVPEKWNCVDVETCTRGNNMGWRYFMFTSGALVFVLSLLRVTGKHQSTSSALNFYYGTLYAYTPEVLPSAHKATGNGIAVAGNRVMGILSALIATVANTTTTAPIFIYGGLLVAVGLVSAVFPFEPYGRRSSG